MVKSNYTFKLVLCAVCTALIAVCSWISIPTHIPFTLQTFAIFITIGLLGAKLGTISIIVYILLGLIGIPVFAGFSSGISVIAGMTGGYIIGFVFTGIAMWGLEKILPKNNITLIISMILGLLICYAFGTAWFIQVYSKKIASIGLIASLQMCVFPFVIPDLTKIACAVIIVNRVKKYVNIPN